MQLSNGVRSLGIEEFVRWLVTQLEMLGVYSVEIVMIPEAQAIKKNSLVDEIQEILDTGISEMPDWKKYIQGRDVLDMVLHQVEKNHAHQEPAKPVIDIRQIPLFRAQSGGHGKFFEEATA